MTCQDCEIYLAQGEISGEVEEHLHQCAECCALSQDLRANALALESLRNEELPRLAVKIPRRRQVYLWRSLYPWAAAAALFALALLAPRTPPLRPAPSRVVNEPAPPPLKIKMLTPDPNVVIYWLIDNY